VALNTLLRVAAALAGCGAVVSCGTEKVAEGRQVVVTDSAVQADTFAAQAFPASYKRPVRETWTLSTSGAGPLRFGMSLADAIVATNGDFYTPKANLDCTYFRSSRSPLGVAVMVVNRIVTRVVVDAGSTATTEGVRIGSTEDEIEAAYPGRVTTSSYANGNVLRVSGESGGEMVFETIGGRVHRFHVGQAPPAQWREGC
jgi:hypothetical protein